MEWNIFNHSTEIDTPLETKYWMFVLKKGKQIEIYFFSYFVLVSNTFQFELFHTLFELIDMTPQNALK